MKSIRTRYAPSPTGKLHIGGARTALFCYLYAKHYQGTFIVRIEDTDLERNISEGEKSQLDNLAWLGIIADESPLSPNPKFAPYRQSQKFDRYYQLALELIDKKLAYKAYDTKEELEAQKVASQKAGHSSFQYDRHWLKISEAEKAKRDALEQYAIRIISSQNKNYQWNDLVRGPISFSGQEIGDWIIIKSNKIATYNFAVVVDDHDMQISHVFRGEEHITNTPRQIMLYQLLNWEIPQFGHFTIITNKEGKKLSKRDLELEQFIEDYQKQGYHPQAIFNFLALLGYTDFSAQEILNQSQFIKRFDAKRFSKSPSYFDQDKMQWFSKKYWQKESVQTLQKLLHTYEFDQAWIDFFLETYRRGFYALSKLQKSLDSYQFLSTNNFQFSEAEKLVITTFIKYLDFQNYTLESIQEAILKTSQFLKIKGKNLFEPLRKALTNKLKGPQLAHDLWLFGKDTIAKRAKKWQ